MSDLKLFNLKNKQEIIKHKTTRQQLAEIIVDNVYDLLGIRIIDNNITLNDNKNEVITSLGYDENYVVTVVEYRIGKFGKTIERGLVYLDYIRQNKSKIKLLFNEKMGKEEAKNLIIEPRLICIGDDFNKYDESAIMHTKEQVDLVKFQSFDKQMILLEKTYQSQKVIRDNFKYQFKSKEELDLFKEISEFVLSLGDEVVEVGFNGYIGYRKIKNFMYIIFEEFITINIKINNKYKTIKIKNYRDFEKSMYLIEESYDNA